MWKLPLLYAASIPFSLTLNCFPLIPSSLCVLVKMVDMIIALIQEAVNSCPSSPLLFPLSSNFFFFLSWGQNTVCMNSLVCIEFYFLRPLGFLALGIQIVTFKQIKNEQSILTPKAFSCN